MMKNFYLIFILSSLLSLFIIMSINAEIVAGGSIGINIHVESDNANENVDNVISSDKTISEEILTIDNTSIEEISEAIETTISDSNIIANEIPTEITIESNNEILSLSNRENSVSEICSIDRFIRPANQMYRRGMGIQIRPANQMFHPGARRCNL